MSQLHLAALAALADDVASVVVAAAIVDAVFATAAATDCWVCHIC